MAVRELKPIVPRPGKPLYAAVRDALRQAIDDGLFVRGEQMPSTKELSERLQVSLVTAHRALQELVVCGVLQRSQGRGTFVHERYVERRSAVADLRFGLIFHRESSLADYYHSQILEGVRQAAHAMSVDLMLLRFGEDVRNECSGYLFVNPLPEELEKFVEQSTRRHPVMVVGATCPLKRVCAIDVDNVDLARQAVGHLRSLGHEKIGYLGGSDQISNSRDRWLGFREAWNDCPRQCCQHVVRAAGWRLCPQEQRSLVKLLMGPQRPTAIFAGGYHFALDAYGAAATARLRIPEDLSVIGVDDPPSAPLLSPSLTTLRQPLVELGSAAVEALARRVQDQIEFEPQQLCAELIIRQSTARPR